MTVRINIGALERLTKQAVTDLLERRGHIACQMIVSQCKAVVSRPATEGADRGPATHGIFQWHPEEHGQHHADKWSSPGSPITSRRGNVHSGEPPYMRTGDNVEAIKYRFVKKDVDKCEVTFGIGQLATRGKWAVLMVHEGGYNPVVHGVRSSTTFRRRWLRPTIRRYWSEFVSILSGVGSEGTMAAARQSGGP